MARLDAALRRVALDDAALAAGCLLAARPDDPVLRTPEGVQTTQALGRAGVLTEGKLLPWVGELLAVVAAPELRVLVETQVGDEVAVPASAWIRGGQAVWGESLVGATTQLSAIEPAHLPWGIARAVGLAERPVSDLARALTVSLDVLGAVEAARERPDRPAGHGGLQTEPPLDDDRQALQALLAARRLSWRVTAARSTAGGFVGRTLAVVDAAHEGLWLVEQLDEDPSQVTLRPTDRATIEELIFALFLTQSAAA